MMIERIVLVAVPSLFVLFLVFLIIFIVSHNKKMERMKDSYDIALSTARHRIQQHMLNNLSYDIIESFGNNLFAVKANLFCEVTTPLQKLSEVMQGALSKPVPEETRNLLSSFLQTVHKIRQNVIDAKRPVEAMNTNMIETCKRLKSNFAENSLMKNLQEELSRLKEYTPKIEVKGKEYPLGTEKEMMLFWLCQEAFNNVIQHSMVKEVYLSIHYDQSSFSLNIRDEGIGFPQKDLKRLMKKGKGFRHMFTAASLVHAPLMVESQPDKGTSISIRFQTLSN